MTDRGALVFPPDVAVIDATPPPTPLIVAVRPEADAICATFPLVVFQITARSVSVTPSFEVTVAVTVSVSPRFNRAGELG